MIHLFWVIPFLISVWVAAITKRQEDDVASMVSIQYGLVMSFVGSLGSLVFSIKR